MTGFELLSQLSKINFQTVFITSFSHYAIKAIRFNALDYLTKPIDSIELKQAIERFQSQNPNFNREQVQQALTNLRTPNPEDQILRLQVQDGEMRLALKNIVRIEGERNYSYIFLSNNKKKLASKTLSHFEEILSDKGFFRCHKSHLVNQHFIKSIQNTSVVLSLNDSEIPVARRKKVEFKKWLEER